jgi:nicotinate-nucleotide adenylyltransferase
MKVAYLGGTFDPVHVGHLWIAQQVCEAHNFDKVFLVPNYSKASSKWNKKVIASNEQRLKMCRLSVKGFEKVSVLSLEIEQKILYTYLTVSLLKCSNERVNWIVGADWLDKLDTFKEYDKLKEVCNFIVINRPGEKTTGLIGVPSIEFKLSSSMIRERISQSLPIKGLVTKEVEKFIEKENLYRRKK